MDIADIAWIREEGPLGSVVFSSRVRVARNLRGVPFPDRAAAQRRRVLAWAREAFSDRSRWERVRFIEIAALQPWERRVLVELNLISPEHAHPEGERAVAVAQEGVVSVMVNEEDHFRIQCLLPGLQLHTAWRIASQFEDLLAEHVEFAFSNHYGYLTACPTNAGTGLRASVMVHVPGFSLSNKTGEMLRLSREEDLIVRGIHGEGSHAAANLYQFVTRSTLGRTEEEMISHLDRVVRDIVERESGLRMQLLRRRREELLDRISRAYATLTAAYLISSSEAKDLLSWVKLGADLGLLPVGPKLVRRLLVCVEPGYIQMLFGGGLPPYRRDILRAQLLREALLGKAEERLSPQVPIPKGPRVT